MGDVKRFDKVWGDGYHPTCSMGYHPACSMEESSDGDWVEWEAHRARVAELEGEVRDLRDANALNAEALDERTREVERLTRERDEARVSCWTERKNIADEYVEPYRAALARAEKAEGELEVIRAARVRTYEPIYKKNESGHCVRVPPSNEPYGRVFGGFERVREVEVTGIQVLVSEDGHGGVAIPLLRITSQRVTSWIALDTDGMRYLALCCDNAAAYSEGRTL